MLSRGRRHFAPGSTVRDIGATALAHKKDQAGRRTAARYGHIPVSMCSGWRLRRESADGNSNADLAVPGMSQRGGAGLPSADALACAACAGGCDRPHRENQRRAGSGDLTAATRCPEPEPDADTQPGLAAPAEAVSIAWSVIFRGDGSGVSR